MVEMMFLYYKTCLMIILLVFSCVYDLVGETKNGKIVDGLNSNFTLDRNESPLVHTLKTKLVKNGKIPNSERIQKVNLARLRYRNVLRLHDDGGEEVRMKGKPARFKRNAQGFDACISEPCKNGGKCIAKSTAGYECFCPQKYTGDQCQTFNVNQQSASSEGVGVDECASKPCKNRGKCIATPPRGYECFCLANYIGDKCEMYYNPEAEATHTGITTPSKRTSHDDRLVMVGRSGHSLVFRATIIAAIVVLSIFTAVSVIGLFICCIANARVNRLRRRMNRKLERGETLTSLPPTFCTECKKMAVDLLVCRFCCCSSNESSEEEQPLQPVRRTSSASARNTRPARSESLLQRKMAAPVSESDDDETILTRYHEDDLVPERKSSRKIRFTQSNTDDLRRSKHGHLDKVPVRRNMSTHALAPHLKSPMTSRERVITGLALRKTQKVLGDRDIMGPVRGNCHAAQSEPRNQSKGQGRIIYERSPLISRLGSKDVHERRQSTVRRKTRFGPKIDHMKQESSSDLNDDAWSDSDASHKRTGRRVQSGCRNTLHRNKPWRVERRYAHENGYCDLHGRITDDSRYRDSSSNGNHFQSTTSHLFNVSMLTPPVTPVPLSPPAPFNR